MLTHDYTDGEHDNAYDVTYAEWTSDDAGTWTRTATAKCNYCGYTKEPVEEKAFDLSYDLNGSEDEQTPISLPLSALPRPRLRLVSRYAKAIPSWAGTPPKMVSTRAMLPAIKLSFPLQ